MRFHAHWARGEHDGIVAYAGSDESLDDARRRAAAAAEALARRIDDGDLPADYGYPDGRPLREEVVEVVRDGDEVVAAITRNSYGALVLNTASAMFIDIDQAGAGCLAPWARRRAGQPSPSEEVPELAALHRVVRDTRDLGVRLYRTFKGYRALVTSGPWDPSSEASAAMLRAAGADPVYARLCASQRSYRARVSPKPWRCGIGRPPSRFPWATDTAEAAYRAWEIDYHERARRRAVCMPMGTLGRDRVDPRIARIAAMHDELCFGEGSLA